MIKQMEEGLSETFGLDVVVCESRNAGMAEAVGGSFEVFAVAGTAEPFTLVTPRPGIANPPVTKIAEAVFAARAASPRHAAYGCLRLSAVERKRLVARLVPFVVSGRQVFLPFLGIALRADSVAQARRWLGRVAQAAILARIRGRLTAPFRDRDIIREVGCSRASAFRAIAELSSFGLAACTPRGIVFVPDLQNVLRLSQPRLRAVSERKSLIEALYPE